MLTYEVANLKNIAIDPMSTIRSYRYNATVLSENSDYRPNCITADLEYLLDYRGTCKYCIENIDKLDINRIQSKFMISGDKLPLYELTHDIVALKVEKISVTEAQFIINENVHLMAVLQEKFEERRLIDEIKRI